MGMIEEYRKAANSLEAEIRHEQQKNETLIEIRLVPDWRKLDQLHIVYGKMMRILGGLTRFTSEAMRVIPLKKILPFKHWVWVVRFMAHVPI